MDDDETDKPMFDLGQEIKTSTSPFLFLAIDLPPMRVFQDATDRNNIIPQVPISEVLRKFNGETTQETAGRLRRYKLTRLPPFLILHIKRFTSNNFVEEKNPTIINFPLKGVDLVECIERPAASSSKSASASTVPNADDPSFTTLYDLVANVTHESTAGTAHEDTTWKSHVHTRAVPKSGQEDDWYQIQDLIVEEINKQMVFLGESYIQVSLMQACPHASALGLIDRLVYPRRSGNVACRQAKPRTTSALTQHLPTFGKRRQKPSVQRQASRVKRQKGRSSTCRSTTALGHSRRARSSKSGNAEIAGWTSSCGRVWSTLLYSRAAGAKQSKRKRGCTAAYGIERLVKLVCKKRHMLQHGNTAERSWTIDAGLKRPWERR